MNAGLQSESLQWHVPEIRAKENPLVDSNLDVK